MNSNVTSRQEYIPALRFRFLTPLYDTTLKYIMRERHYKQKLNSIIPAGARQILDLGCGTGTLTAMIKHSHPASDIVGIDIDSEVLQRAQEKAARGSLRIHFQLGNILQLPFENNSFDAAVSCLVLHHLKTVDKQKALHEIFRVLQPGGMLLLADFSTPHNLAMMGVTTVTQHFEETYDNFHGRLLEFIPNAGFINLSVDSNFSTPIGTVSIITSLKPTN